MNAHSTICPKDLEPNPIPFQRALSENQAAGFFSLAVAWEMNPALRDRSPEEILDLFHRLASEELAQEWASGRGG